MVPPITQREHDWALDIVSRLARLEEKVDVLVDSIPKGFSRQYWIMGLLFSCVFVTLGAIITKTF